MGSGGIKFSKLLKSEVEEYVNMTKLTTKEVSSLYSHFQIFSAIEADNGQINYNEFCLAINAKPSILTHQLFQIFDQNEDEFVNFREFVIGVSRFLKAGYKEKIKLTFKLYDVNNEDKIQPKFVEQIFWDILQNFPQFSLTKEMVNQMVQEIFQSSESNLIEESSYNQKEIIDIQTEYIDLKSEDQIGNADIQISKSEIPPDSPDLLEDDNQDEIVENFKEQEMEIDQV